MLILHKINMHGENFTTLAQLSQYMNVYMALKRYYYCAGGDVQ